MTDLCWRLGASDLVTTDLCWCLGASDLVTTDPERGSFLTTTQRARSRERERESDSPQHVFYSPSPSPPPFSQRARETSRRSRFPAQSGPFPRHCAAFVIPSCFSPARVENPLAGLGVPCVGRRSCYSWGWWGPSSVLPRRMPGFWQPCAEVETRWWLWLS